MKIKSTSAHWIVNVAASVSSLRKRFSSLYLFVFWICHEIKGKSICNVVALCMSSQNQSVLLVNCRVDAMNRKGSKKGKRW